MADSSIAVTPGVGSNVDTRTNATGDHRQVVVFGHPSATDSVAEVLGKDPDSNTEGVVVRDPYTTNIVSGLRDVRIQSIVDGTIGVENITRVRNVVDGTLSTIVRLSNLVDGTLSTVSRVSNVVDGTLTTITGLDRVRNVIDGTLSVVSFVPQVQRVSNVVDGTLTTITGVDRVRNIVDGTLTTVTNLGTLTRADRVMNLVDGTITFIPTVQRVQNVVDGTLTTVSRVDRVMHLIDGTITTVAAVTGITNSIAAHILSTNGTMAVNIGTIAGSAAVYFSPSRPVVLADNLNTANIFTVAGSTAGVSVSGVQLVAPSANASFKVFAFSLQTTGIVSVVARFTNGAGTSPVEFFRGLVTANQTSSAPIGANLAVQPPGFLFATGVSTTLALLLDTGTLVHYSVSYIKESA